LSNQSLVSSADTCCSGSGEADERRAAEADDALDDTDAERDLALSLNALSLASLSDNTLVRLFALDAGFSL